MAEQALQVDKAESYVTDPPKGVLARMFTYRFFVGRKGICNVGISVPYSLLRTSKFSQIPERELIMGATAVSNS